MITALKRHRRILTAMTALVILSACQSSEEKAFIAACQSDRGLTEQTCTCVNDLIADNFEDKGQRYVRALFLGQQQEVARIQASFSLIEGSTILTRAGWIAANSQQACGIQM